MRRITLAITAALLAVALCACENTGSGEASYESEKESSASGQVSEEVSGDGSVESEGETGKETGGMIKYQFPAGENTVYLTENEDNTLTLWIKYKDGERVEIHTDPHMQIIEAKASPDGKKILFSNYEWECCATVFLYDAESREKSTVEISGIPEGHVPYYLDWVDNRNFMFNIIFDQGTVAIGGEVYVCDIEAEPKIAQKAIAAESDRLQIMSFERDGANYVIKAGYYDESYNEYETLLYTVSFSEIKALISNGEMTLLAENGTKAEFEEK